MEIPSPVKFSGKLAPIEFIVHKNNKKMRYDFNGVSILD